MSLPPKRLEQLLEQAYEAQDTERLDEFLATLDPAERDELQRHLTFNVASPSAASDSGTADVSARVTVPHRTMPSDAVSVPLASDGRLPTDPMIGVEVGDYRIERHLGSGGSATVYLAVRVGKVKEQVALKLLNETDPDRQRQVLKRFEQEQRVLATFDHRHIARFLGSGQIDDGRPFLVMEYIEGQPIDKYCDHRPLTLSERLKLFQQVCRAVSYCHQRGVIHRDLSVNDILVTNDGTPKLVDFGIAKVVKEVVGSSPRIITGDTELLGTLDFASPEQLRHNEVITAISDVYSLGCLLYRLLIGQYPLDVSGKPWSEWHRLITDPDEEATSPSKILARLSLQAEASHASNADPIRIATDRATNTSKLQGSLRGDLDTIALKAVRKLSKDRYKTPDELFEDIRNYFDHRPVVAHKGSGSYRLRKFVRRHRGSMSAAATVLIVLIGGIAGTSWGMFQARRAQIEAEGTSVRLASVNQ